MAETGFSEAIIADLEARMMQFVSDKEVEGISTLLVHKGEEVSRKVFGKLRVRDDAPIQRDSIYRIYSMTKPVTGVAMMMLFEEGKFSLDDPITRFVPQFEKLKVLSPPHNPSPNNLKDPDHIPTMRELLSHTAGFGYGLWGEDYTNAQFREMKIMDSEDMESFIEKVASVPLLNQPGAEWFYSCAVDIQGYIVEQITGEKFSSFLQKRIFDPLDMVDTGFYVPEAKLDRFGELFAYVPQLGGLAPLNKTRYAYRKETVRMESGGGGLVGTIDDYANFCQMLLNGGEFNGHKLISPESIQLMRTNLLEPHMEMGTTGTIDTVDASGRGFGLNFGVITEPEKTGIAYGKDTYFWGGAAGTWFWIDPVNELFFIGMIQRMGAPQDFREDSARLVYKALNTK